jgi:hypothetical protein
MQFQTYIVALLLFVGSALSCSAEESTSFPTALQQQANAEYDSMIGCGSNSDECCSFDEEYARPAPIATWWMNSSTRKFCQWMVDNTNANNRWPQPFVCPDRCDTRLPFQLMVAKGWKRQNTLDEQYFTPEGKLNSAGRLQIRRILLEGLPEYRTLYVRRAPSQEETEIRLDSTQQFIAKVLPNEPLPGVGLTNLPTAQRPASSVEATERLYDENRPVPRLPITLSEDNTSSE